MTNDVINDIIKFCNIQCKSILKIDFNDKNGPLYQNANKCEKQTYQSEIIRHHFPQENDEVFFDTYRHYPIATQSFCFLLDFVQKHNPGLINKIIPPIFENCSERLVLANHSLNQLNIISDNRYTGKLSSVCNFLNSCVTNMGKRKFTYDLLNPIKNCETLSSIYNITEHILNNNTWEHYRKQLQTVKDIEKLNRKLIIKRITPKDITYIYHITNNALSLFDKVQKDKTLLDFIDQPNILTDCNLVNSIIVNTFDIQKAESISDISPDGLSNHSVEHLSFIKKGMSVDIDYKIKEYFDSRSLNVLGHISQVLYNHLKRKQIHNLLRFMKPQKATIVLLGQSAG